MCFLKYKIWKKLKNTKIYLNLSFVLFIPFSTAVETEMRSEFPVNLSDLKISSGGTGACILSHSSSTASKWTHKKLKMRNLPFLNSIWK